MQSVGHFTLWRVRHFTKALGNFAKRQVSLYITGLSMKKRNNGVGAPVMPASELTNNTPSIMVINQTKKINIFFV